MFACKAIYEMLCFIDVYLFIYLALACNWLNGSSLKAVSDPMDKTNKTKLVCFVKYYKLLIRLDVELLIPLKYLSVCEKQTL